MAVLLRTLSEALLATQGNSTVLGEDQTLPAVYRRRCRKSLKEAIKITRGLSDSDFPFIDVVMAVRFPLPAMPVLHVTEDLCPAGMLVPDLDDHGRVGPGRRRDGGQLRKRIPAAFRPARFKESNDKKRSANYQDRTDPPTASSIST